MPVVFNGLSLELHPRVSWDPRFAATTAQLRLRFGADPSKVKISNRSMLMVTGPGASRVKIESLDLDGALVIDVSAGGQITIDGLCIRNDGWVWCGLEELPADEPEPYEWEQIRGFRVLKRETKTLVVRSGESLVVKNDL